MRMSDSQEENLAYVQSRASSWIDKKYRAGAKEHSGDLFDLSNEELVDNAIDEAVDQMVFLLTLRRRMLCK